jgi:hypothetical protein
MTAAIVTDRLPNSNLGRQGPLLGVSLTKDHGSSTSYLPHRIGTPRSHITLGVSPFLLMPAYSLVNHSRCDLADRLILFTQCGSG